MKDRKTFNGVFLGLNIFSVIYNSVMLLKGEASSVAPFALGLSLLACVLITIRINKEN